MNSQNQRLNYSKVLQPAIVVGGRDPVWNQL